MIRSFLAERAAAETDPAADTWTDEERAARYLGLSIVVISEDGSWTGWPRARPSRATPTGPRRYSC